MYLNELMKLCRKEFGENQEEFYKDIFLEDQPVALKFIISMLYKSKI